MTRIIGGTAGSLRLRTPGPATRPTSDRVREAWFSTLESRRDIEGARVLDLYAGSGALGLEAASRGAAEVTLVDKHQKAVATIRENIQTISAALPEGVTLRVVASSAQHYLDQLPPASLDLVFIDPPYGLASDQLTPVLAAVCEALAPGGWAMLERPRSGPIPEWPSSMVPLLEKTYGDTSVEFAEKS